MKGDFSRFTFDPDRAYTAVLYQQGRIQLDADFNEQSAIMRHELRELAKLLIGPHGGEQHAFQVRHHAMRRDAGEPTQDPQSDILFADIGTYYVDGIRCVNGKPIPLLWFHSRHPPKDEEYLVYLDVWEHEVLPVQDPHLVDEAIAHADATLRADVSWHVRFARIRGTIEHNDDDDLIEWLIHQLWRLADAAAVAFARWLGEGEETEEIRSGLNRRDLVRDAVKFESWEDAAALIRRENPPRLRVAEGSTYNGDEHALYRVEIHDPGESGEATFKVSHDNGATVCQVFAVHNDTLTVSPLGSQPMDLKENDCLELVTDRTLRARFPLPLLRVVSISDNADENGRWTLQVDPPGAAAGGLDSRHDPERLHALLRRWDDEQPVEPDQAIDVGYGIKVEFEAGEYRRGDAWLIPARVGGRDDGIEWPRDRHGERRYRGPRDVHHIAPLALVHSDGARLEVEDLRSVVPPPTRPRHPDRDQESVEGG